MGIGINWQVLVVQLINFALLFGLLGWVLYKPVIKMLDERAQRIRESIEQADKVRQQATQAGEEVKVQLESARKEGQVLIGQASQIGERVKEEARQQARVEADAIVAKARIEIQRERDDAIDELRREFADLTVLAAEKVIHESLNKATHQKVINEVLEKSATLRKG